MQSNVPEPVFLNVEYIFSWLWGHIFGPLFSQNTIAFLQFLLSILIIIGITIILYSLVRIHEMKQDDAKKAAKEKKVETPITTASTVSTPGAPALPGAIIDAPVRNETWEHIRSKLLSESQSDWRLAIIEADIYLDRVLDTRGVPGDTLGDKLKNVSPDILPSVQIAWEAHKVRNRIAHDGADFALTMPEARRVLSYFEIVFRDLRVIE
jgi:hypothetical protein